MIECGYRELPEPRAKRLRVGSGARRLLQALVDGRGTPSSIRCRARIILLAWEGQTNYRIARTVGVTVWKVLLWRRRYQEEGISRLLMDKPGRGRKPEVQRKTVADIVEGAIRSRLQGGPGSVRALAELHGVSPATVQRILRAHGLGRHREPAVPFEPDRVPTVEHKLLGVFFAPPDRVLGFESRLEQQPLRYGHSEFQRQRPVHGSRSDFIHEPVQASTDLLDGLRVLEWTSDSRFRRDKLRTKGFLDFCESLKMVATPGAEIHLVVASEGTHCLRYVCDWLEDGDFHMHIAVLSGWLTLVQEWTTRARQGGQERSESWRLPELVKQVVEYLSDSSLRSQPFRSVRVTPAARERALDKVLEQRVRNVGKPRK